MWPSPVTSNKLNAVSMNLEVILVCSILIKNSAKIRKKETDETGEIPQMANICKYEHSFENGCEIEKDIFNILS